MIPLHSYLTEFVSLCCLDVVESLSNGTPPSTLFRLLNFSDNASRGFDEYRKGTDDEIEDVHRLAKGWTNV